MATYLLTWNPRAWEWEDLPQCIAATRAGEKFDAALEWPPSEMSWSTGVTKRIAEGDRCFLMRLGLGIKPKGIMGSGFFESSPYEAPSWTGELGKMALFSPIRFDTLLHPDDECILHLETLKAMFPSVKWTPQSSGQSIPEPIASELERLWQEKLSEQKVVSQIFIEGSARRVVLDQRERSSKARLKCIEHHGLNCAVCGFNFGDFYGGIGEGKIHVHHLKPLGKAVEEREVDPIQDLRPVCANCHYVIHGQKEPRTLGEMRDAVAQNSKFIRR